MNSIIKRDLLFSKRIKYTILIFIVYLIYFFIQKWFISHLFDNGIMDAFTRTIGITYNKIHFLDILIIILSNIYLIYISLSIYLNDLESGKEQILLRMDRKRYILYKIFKSSKRKYASKR